LAFYFSALPHLEAGKSSFIVMEGYEPLALSTMNLKGIWNHPASTLKASHPDNI
jgi:hypothetical protein